MIVDWNFYKNMFLLGREAAIPETEFLFWADAALTRINRRNWFIENPDLTLKKAICWVAEKMYENNQAPKTGDVIQFTNANYSERVATISDTHIDIDKDIDKGIKNFLFSTKWWQMYNIGVLG